VPRSRRLAPTVAGGSDPTPRGGRHPALLGAPKPYPHRVTLDLTTDDHRALRVAAATEGLTMAEVLRALVALWRADEGLAAAVRDHIATQPRRVG
jgi:hypothetical protein